MPPPHSHFLKANWAGKLLEQLNTSVGDWFEAGQHFTHEIVADPKTPEAFLLVVGADSIPMAPFGLVVGDIVNNLRGSLDHIVRLYQRRLAWRILRLPRLPVFRLRRC